MGSPRLCPTGEGGDAVIELRYPVTWERPDNSNGEEESDRLCHVNTPTDWFPGDVAIARVFDADHARRIAAALNATATIPTETLEAGVVVVPVEQFEALTLLADGCPQHPSYRAKRRVVTICERCNAMWEARQTLSRLQQNEEPPADSRITVTIDLQTWQGYRDRRVIEVEPGLGWADRLVPDVAQTAQEMERMHLKTELAEARGWGFTGITRELTQEELDGQEPSPLTLEMVEEAAWEVVNLAEQCNHSAGKNVEIGMELLMDRLRQQMGGEGP
jgi:hypothetical protein